MSYTPEQIAENVERAKRDIENPTGGAARGYPITSRRVRGNLRQGVWIDVTSVESGPIHYANSQPYAQDSTPAVQLTLE